MQYRGVLAGNIATVTRNLLLVIPVGLIVVVLTWLALGNPVLALLCLVAVVLLGVFIRTRDWWRLTYTATIVSMFVGASHFEALASIGPVLKMLALVVLAAVTFATTAGEAPKYENKLHTFTISLLWAIAGYGVFSTIWSTDRTESIVEGLSFMAFVFIVHKVSAIRWKDRTAMFGDIHAAYWASLVMLTVGLLLGIAGVEGVVSSYSGRHLGLLNNPNLLGLVAAVTFAIGIGVASYRRSTLVWVSLLIPLSQVLLSQSRTAILATGLAVLWVLMRSGIVKAFVALFVVITGMLAAIAFRFNPLEGSFDRFGDNGAGGVLNYRTNVWSDVFGYLTANPLGAGWATTNSTLGELSARGMTSGFSSIHNSYLQLMFELGWIGIIPAVLIVATLVVVAWRAPVTGVGAGLVGATVAGALIQITESTIFGIGQPYPYLFWFAVLAAIVYIRRLDDEQADTKDTSEPAKRTHLVRRKALTTK